MPGIKRWSLLLALLALALPPLCLAQTPAEVGMPVLRNYTPRDYGGYTPDVWSILQDRRGVLFFGSEVIILEYDGVTWRKIPVPSAIARSLSMDDKGKIWVGAYGDFGYLEPDANGTLQYRSLLEKVPQEDRRFNDVWQVLITPQGNFFRSYERLFRWDGRHMHVWTTPTSFEALSELRGRIYTSQKGVGLEEIVGDELHPLPGGDAYKNSPKLFLHPYDNGRILISARDELLTLYDGEKVTPFPTAVDDYLKKDHTYTSIPLPDGGICVTTISGGAVILEHDGRLRRIINKAAGLQNDAVFAAYPDREGALWLGTGRGITRVEANSPISIFSRDPIAGIARHQGTLYAADASSGTALFRLAAQGQTSLSSLQPIPSSATQAFCLLTFHDPAGKAPDQLLAATNDGVMKIDGDTVSAAPPSLKGPAHGAYCVVQSRKSPNRVFVGGENYLSSMRWEGGKWIGEGRLPNFNDGAQYLAEQSDGTLWAAAGSGNILHVEVPSTGMRGGESTTEFYRERRLGESRKYRRLCRRTDLRHSQSCQVHPALGSRDATARPGQPILASRAGNRRASQPG